MLRSPILALAHLPAKVALVNVDKEVIFLLVSAHVDETNPTNVAPAGNLSITTIPLFLSLTSLYTWPCCALSSCEDHTFVFENKFAGTLDKRSLIEKYENEKQWLGGLKNLSECLPPVESVAASMSSLLHSSLT